MELPDPKRAMKGWGMEISRKDFNLTEIHHSEQTIEYSILCTAVGPDPKRKS